MRKVVMILIGVFITFGMDNNLNAQNMNTLDGKQQQIAAIAANTAIGNIEVLKITLNAGLDAGLTIIQIKEILVQMYAYCGFPRSLQGINTFMAVMDERKAKGLKDCVGLDASEITDNRNKYVRGKENLQQLTGVTETVLSGANAFAPIIDVFLKEHLFADIFERNVLTFQERELATISALAAMEGVDPMLSAHVKMGENVGLNQQQIEEAVGIARAASSDNREFPVFPIGNIGPSDWFTGEAYVQGLVHPAEMEGLYSVGQVTFMPAARTHWHTHPIGQTLLVLEGCGWYQERGESAQLLVKGSTVTIPKGVEHWHGASVNTKLVHIAISNVADGSNVTWMSPVNDEEYAIVHK